MSNSDKKIGSIRARLQALTKPNRTRTEGVLHWIADSPASMVVFNLFLWVLFHYVRVSQRVGRVWGKVKARLFPGKAGAEAKIEFRTDEPFPARPAHEKPRVLLVIEETVPQCFRYRVEQKMHQFDALGWHSEWVSWRHGGRARERMHLFDIVIFYRVPGFPDVLLTIRYAKALNKLTIYDTDDLIFDRSRLEEKFKGGSGQLSQHDYEQMLKGAELYQNALKLCDYATTSTPSLAKEIEQVIGQDRVQVLPNALDKAVFDVLEHPKADRDESVIRLIYGSGTRTHDEDFALVGDVLARLMNKYEQLRLVIVGYLTLPEALAGFENRIQRLPLMDFDVYLGALRYADISIAPLEQGIFADCKSEIKWLEAGVFGVPSVVTPTATYRAIVEDGTDGLFADGEQEWESHLSALIESSELRERVGEAARHKARAHYGREAMKSHMQGLIRRFQKDMCERSEWYQAKSKMRILVVNTFYPPETVGGATIVVIRTVEELKKRYGDDIEVVVLKSELTLTSPYSATEYVWNGVLVTTIGIPPEDNFEWKYRDQYLKDTYDEFLDYFQPDLVHFHCMQRLTGTLMESAMEKQIPYVVTVHDAWWISEHQFLLDDDAQLVGMDQLNPLVVAQTSDDTEAAVKRSAYLSGLLKNADRIFAVSEYQAGIYRQNGFNNVSVNKNGVPDVLQIPRTKSISGKLCIGYAGGVCDHKGYYSLKKLVEQSDWEKLEFHVIDLDFDDTDYRAKTRWGETQVTTWGRQTPESMETFYESIDVLLAPSIWPESFGLATREAALRGRWVVAADAGGLAEDVISDKTGFSYTMLDNQALESILAKLNQEAQWYLDNNPDVDASRQQITTLPQQVDELVSEYRSVIGTQG